MKGVDQDQGLAKLLDSDESSSDSDEEEKKKKDEDEDDDEDDGKGKGKKVNYFKSYFVCTELYQIKSKRVSINQWIFLKKLKKTSKGPFHCRFQLVHNLVIYTG